jgi:hypothetical protein
MRRLKKIQSKAVIGLLLSLLILLASAGATVAYIVLRTDRADNTFTPVTVDSTPVATAQGGIAVSNNGEIAAYLRAAVVVTWVSVDAEGNTSNAHHINAPMEGRDYSMGYDASGSWQKGSDGFWYYKTPVDAGGVTVDLITSMIRMTDPPEGYALSVEVVTTGIQAMPTDAVEQAWGVSVNGTALTPN